MFLYYYRSDILTSILKWIQNTKTKKFNHKNKTYAGTQVKIQGVTIKQDLRWHTGNHTRCHHKTKTYAGKPVNIQGVTIKKRLTLAQFSIFYIFLQNLLSIKTKYNKPFGCTVSLITLKMVI